MKSDLLSAIARLAIDYFRWTQLIPMLTCWAFLTACLLAFLVTSFESQGMAALEIVVAIVFGIASLLPESIVPRSADGSIDLSGNNLLDLAGWAWFALSLIAMLINWLVGERLRPDFLKTLGGRIRTAGIAAIAFAVALAAVPVFAPANFNGSFLSWLPFLIGAPLMTWIVSVYSLSISAVLSSIETALLTNRPARA